MQRHKLNDNNENKPEVGYKMNKNNKITAAAGNNQGSRSPLGDVTEDHRLFRVTDVGLLIIATSQ